MTTFICIGGKAQNGKDTSAKILKQAMEDNGAKVVIAHYADLLKFICKNYFGWNGQKDDVGRTLLQKVGTEGVRSKRPDFWVDFVLDVVDLFPNEWDYIIIPDTRFPNEINRIKEHGYPTYYLRVNRMDFQSPLSPEQQQHPSEVALDGVSPDYLIENRTLDELQNDIYVLCKEILGGSSTRKATWPYGYTLHQTQKG